MRKGWELGEKRVGPRIAGGEKVVGLGEKKMSTERIREGNWKRGGLNWE